MKQIIAIGSGGMEEKNPCIELYILAQSQKTNPRILFIGTPSGDNPGYIEYFKKYFGRFPCKPSYLSLFNPPTKDLADFVMSNDIVFVSGGHSRNALVLWHSWGLDAILHNAYDDGIILSGGSAGSVVWFKECITDSIPGKLSVMPCLGILPYSNCPHYRSKERREVYKKNIMTGKIKSGYGIDDGCAAHFVDGKFLRSVSIIDGSTTYHCSKNENQFVSNPQENRLLNNDAMEELVWNTKTFANMSE